LAEWPDYPQLQQTPCIQGTIQELVRAGEQLLRPDGFHHPFAGCKICG
jgi:hypothetical protein